MFKVVDKKFLLIGLSISPAVVDSETWLIKWLKFRESKNPRLSPKRLCSGSRLEDRSVLPKIRSGFDERFEFKIKEQEQSWSLKPPLTWPSIEIPLMICLVSVLYLVVTSIFFFCRRRKTPEANVNAGIA